MSSVKIFYFKKLKLIQMCNMLNVRKVKGVGSVARGKLFYC